MIKKRIKPWYPTKEKEIQGELTQKLLDAANHIHRTSMNNYGNWVIVGTDVANALNDVVYTTTHTYTPGLSYTNYTAIPVASGTTNFITFSG